MPLPPRARLLDAGLAFFSHSDTQGRPPNPTVFFVCEIGTPPPLAIGMHCPSVDWVVSVVSNPFSRTPAIPGGAPVMLHARLFAEATDDSAPLVPGAWRLFPSSWITSFRKDEQVHPSSVFVYPPDTTPHSRLVKKTSC